VGSVSQVFAWHPGACSKDVHAVTRKSCSGQEYWTSGDLELSSTLSTLVIVSQHGATPMRRDGVCVNGESLLFNTSSLSSSLSLSLFVQVGRSLKGTSCGVFNCSSCEPTFFFPAFLSYTLLIYSIIHDHRLWYFRGEHTWGAMYVIPLPEGRLLIALLILLNAHFIRMNVARATEE